MQQQKVDVVQALQLIAKDPLRYAGCRRVTVPEQQSGMWTIKRFSVSDFQYAIELGRAIAQGYGFRAAPPGDYTGLFFDDPAAATPKNPHGRGVMMSDTPAEMADHLPIIKAADGHVLVTGLGLGMVADGLALKSNVKKITVVEKDEHIIRMVYPHLQSLHGDKIVVVHADAFKWETPTVFGAAWHDIWPKIDPDNLSDMRKLRRRYKAAWHGCWKEKQCKAMRAFEKNPSRETALRAVSAF
jgi:hypothetical protein